jgi:quercetin dioxygenase-like cupin family protein
MMTTTLDIHRHWRFCFALSLIVLLWNRRINSFVQSFNLQSFNVVTAADHARRRALTTSASFTVPPTSLAAAPKGALTDIVIPNVFTGGILQDAVASTEHDDDRVWVPQTDCLDFRPLCFCVSQGYYVNLLRFRGGGVLGCHRHPSPVHALTLQGTWGYKEHDWKAKPGTYVFEPPGETHTLLVDSEEMVTLFHVTGALIYVDPDTGETTGYDDVFTKLQKARTWYKECGLGEEYAEQFIR